MKKLSDKEIARRIRETESAIGSVEMEGVPVSPAVKEIAMQQAKGELSPEEALNKVLAFYKIAPTNAP